MKILVRLPNWLGDVVMSVAFIKSLRNQFPEAEIHVIIKKELSEIVALIKEIDTIHLFSKSEFNGLLGLLKFGKQFKSQKFDLFYCLPYSLSAAIISWASNAKIRIGFKNDFSSIFFTQSISKPKNVHRVVEYLSLLNSKENLNDSRFNTHLIINQEHKNNIILINFNSEAVSRRMPLDKAVSIIRTIELNFPESSLGFIGSSKDSDYVNSLISNFKNPLFINFSGKTNLIELMNLMASSSVLLTTDSGPAHLANSVSTPVIVLFGAGDENNTAPFNTKNRHIIRLGKLPCEPCKKNTCKFGDTRCLGLLPLDEIVELLRKYVNFKN